MRDKIERWGPFAFGGNLQVPRSIVSDTLPPDAQTLIIGSDFQNVGLWTGLASSNMLFEVKMNAGAGYYWRRFALGFYDTIEIPCGPFHSFELNLLMQPPLISLANAPRINVAASTGLPDPHRRTRVRWPQRCAAAGQYQVPPGAQTVVSPNADAGWSWQVYDTVGVISVPQALNIGIPLAVQGVNFTTVAFPLSLVWDIEL